MSEHNHMEASANDQDEDLLRAYAIANETFDEEDITEEAAAKHFGVTIDYVRKGQTGLHPTPRIGNWMKRRYEEAGWEYMEK